MVLVVGVDAGWWWSSAVLVVGDVVGGEVKKLVANAPAGDVSTANCMAR